MPWRSVEVKERVATKEAGESVLQVQQPGPMRSSRSTNFRTIVDDASIPFDRNRA